MLAPVVLFTYNRLDLTINTVRSLLENRLAEQSELYIYSDGPKPSDDTNSVNNVRNYIHTIGGFKNITIVERTTNMGLSNNIIDGVTDIISRFEKVIVLEDDLEVSPHFLEFMNSGLELYEDVPKVCQIYGYSYFEKYALKYRLDDLLFIKGADCLGWGTWKRAWRYFEPDAKKLVRRINHMGDSFINEFDWGGAYNYFKLLQKCAKNKVDSWAIRWLASTFLEDMYLICPLKSLVVHRGNRYGTHYYRKRKKDPLCVPLSNDPINIELRDVIQKENTKNAYIEFLKELKPSLPNRVLNQLYKFITNNIG